MNTIIIYDIKLTKLCNPITFSRICLKSIFISPKNIADMVRLTRHKNKYLSIF